MNYINSIFKCKTFLFFYDLFLYDSIYICMDVNFFFINILITIVHLFFIVIYNKRFKENINVFFLKNKIIKIVLIINKFNIIINFLNFYNIF
jgi:hypothetical protein